MRKLLSFLAVVLLIQASPEVQAEVANCKGMNLPTPNDLAALAYMPNTPEVKHSPVYQQDLKLLTGFYKNLLLARRTERLEEFEVLLDKCVRKSQSIQFLSGEQVAQILTPAQIEEMRAQLRKENWDDPIVSYLIASVYVLMIGGVIFTFAPVIVPTAAAAATAGFWIGAGGMAMAAGGGAWALGRVIRTGYRAGTAREMDGLDRLRAEELGSDAATAQLEAIIGSALHEQVNQSGRP